MPTEDVDIRTEPSLGDPQGLLSPSEKLNALFLALTDHINADLTRKHGEDCELCSGTNTPAYLLPVPPALIVQVPAPASAAIPTLFGRCARCELNRELTREVTGRARYTGRPGRWSLGDRVCLGCATTMMQADNPYTFRAVTPPQPATQPAERSDSVLQAPCPNCHERTTLPYRIAEGSHTSLNLHVGMLICRGCGERMHPGGVDYRYGWRGELVTPAEPETIEPGTIPMPEYGQVGSCSNCYANPTPLTHYLIGNIDHDEQYVWNERFRPGTLLCGTCGLSMEEGGESYRNGWRSALILPIEAVVNVPAVNPWTCDACGHIQRIPARFAFQERLNEYTSLHSGDPLCDVCGPRMRPGSDHHLYRSGYRSIALATEPVPEAPVRGCSHGSYTHQVVASGSRYSEAPWNQIGYQWCARCAADMTRGYPSLFPGLVLEELHPTEPVPADEVIADEWDRSSRCRHDDCTVLWFVSRAPRHSVRAGRGYCDRCAEIILDSESWPGVELRRVPEENPCTGYILNGNIHHDSSCIVHAS